MGTIDSEVGSQIIDGAMLSDAGVYFAHGGGPTEQAYFELGLSGWEHDDWLKEVSNAIEVLGAGIALNAIKYEIKARVTGGTYEDCRLKTRTHPLFTSVREKWYVGNVKVVPGNLAIPPLLLTHWFIGDGDSVWGASGIPNLVEARFGTYCFSSEEVGRLRLLLGKYRINTSLERRKDIVHGAGLRIRVRNSSAVNRLMDLVEPFVLPSYRYKIKRPWLRKRGPKTGHSYKRCWVPNLGWQTQEVKNNHHTWARLQWEDNFS